MFRDIDEMPQPFRVAPSRGSPAWDHDLEPTPTCGLTPNRIPVSDLTDVFLGDRRLLREMAPPPRLSGVTAGSLNLVPKLAERRSRASRDA
jgi:hypothetical protein